MTKQKEVFVFGFFFFETKSHCHPGWSEWLGSGQGYACSGPRGAASPRPAVTAEARYKELVQTEYDIWNYKYPGSNLQGPVTLDKSFHHSELVFSSEKQR